MIFDPIAPATRVKKYVTLAEYDQLIAGQSLEIYGEIVTIKDGPFYIVLDGDKRLLERILEDTIEPFKSIQIGTERHGDHEDQKGRPGEAGGSQPGFTHVEGGGEGSTASERVQTLLGRADVAGLNVGTTTESMIETQATAVERDWGFDEDEGGREGFEERWNELLEGTEADPEYIEYVLEGVVEAREQGIIPEDVGVVIRKPIADRPSEEFAAARWNGHILVIQSELVRDQEGIAWEKRLHENERKSIDDIGGTDRGINGVSNLYDHFFTGVAAHEYGHEVENRLVNEHVKTGTESPSTRAARLIKDDSKRVEKWVSVYATGAAHELVAEAYALTRHPQFDEMPDETKAIVSEIFGDDTP